MRSIVLSCTALALAACGSPDPDADGDGKISMEEAAAHTKDMVKPEPGQYRATVEMVDMQMPDAPPEVQEMMKGMMGMGAQTHEYCLTEEEAAKGFEEMTRKAQDDQNCSFEKFDADGGTIDAVMVCEDDGEGQMRMTMQGEGTSTSSNMTMNMDAKGPGGETMKITMKSTQERIGDCDA